MRRREREEEREKKRARKRENERYKLRERGEDTFPMQTAPLWLIFEAHVLGCLAAHLLFRFLADSNQMCYHTLERHRLDLKLDLERKRDEPLLDTILK